MTHFLFGLAMTMVSAAITALAIYGNALLVTVVGICGTLFCAYHTALMGWMEFKEWRQRRR